MNDEEQIKSLIHKYAEIIHTQNAADWENLWSGEPENTLIAVSAVFRGFPSISSDFLTGIIRSSYSSIVLSIDSDIDVHFVNPDTAVAVFQYHTECVRRDTGEAFGIEGPETHVWKRCQGQWKLYHDHYSKK